MPSWLRTWLKRADTLVDADLIFVLAGRPYRKVFGLQLFRESHAPRLILSVARFEIRRFKDLPLPEPLDLLPIAGQLAPPERHFFVIWDFVRNTRTIERIHTRRYGTLREIEALAKYLEGNRGVKSVLVLTSGLHVRRVRMCCNALIPAGVKFSVAAAPTRQSESPATSQDNNKDISDDTFLATTRELAKLILYRALLWRPIRSKERQRTSQHNSGGIPS
jgi:hypothetical protein